MSPRPIPAITVTDLKERLDREQPLVLVDVREPFEADIADLPEVGQKRIPMAHLLRRMDELDPDDVHILYCRSGNRSEWAAGQLLDRGFDQVYNLEGGVLAWREEIDPSLESY